MAIYWTHDTQDKNPDARNILSETVRIMRDENLTQGQAMRKATMAFREWRDSQTK